MKIIIDTNLLSELMRPAPAPSVLAWVAERPIDTLFSTTISYAEIGLGIALLPNGTRRDGLRAAAERIFVSAFADRILPFDRAAAAVYARVVADRRKIGRPIGTLDAQIASIALAAKASVATRNVADFELCGIDIIDPWAFAF